MTAPSVAQGEPNLIALPLSVVICCYTAARRRGLDAGIDAAITQLGPADELIVVVDGNAQLHRDLSDSYGERSAFIENSFRCGLSGARNAGLAAATGDVVVFLDDDAVLHPGALSGVRTAFADDSVVGLGGAVHPDWQCGGRPDWFPPEFNWVVGCDYRGLPPAGATIRNPIGAAMAVRRDRLVAVGGFSTRLGRVGALPVGCEETMMGIELVRRYPSARIIRSTDFAVSHSVSRDREKVTYFVRRCYHEGRSKAILTRLCGRRSSLDSERTYTTRTLPAGLWRARRRPLRALALVTGLLATTVGYVDGVMRAVTSKE